MTWPLRYMGYRRSTRSAFMALPLDSPRMGGLEASIDWIAVEIGQPQGILALLSTRLIPGPGTSRTQRLSSLFLS